MNGVIIPHDLPISGVFVCVSFMAADVFALAAVKTEASPSLVFNSGEVLIIDLV